MEETRIVNLRKTNPTKRVEKTLDDILSRVDPEKMNGNPYFAIAYESMRCELVRIEKQRRNARKKGVKKCCEK
jgi:hypothetical protein